MISKKFDLIVIGAGSGGLIAAIGAKYLGARVLIIEKGKIGGDCLNYGCVPSKAIIAAAHTAHTIADSDQFGISDAHYSVDFERVIKRVQNIIKSIAKSHDSIPVLEKLGITVVTGAAEFVDRHQISVDKVIFYGKKIVIATGGRPNTPPIEGLAETGFLTNLNLFTIKKQPKHLIILGGGPIGTEMAQAFVRLGSRVTMIIRSRLVPKEDADVAELLGQVLTREGVVLKTGTNLQKVTKKGDQKAVLIEVDGKIEEIVGDEILASLGRAPNTAGLNLDEIGIKYNRRGIEINSKMQTSIPHIYACGDVCGPFQFTHLASYQAGLIIYNAFTPLSSKADYKAFPWTTFTDPEVAHVGATEKDAEKNNYQIYKFPLKKVDRAKAESLTDGFIKVIVDKKGYLKGTTIIAKSAGELLPEYTLALRLGLKIDDIYNTVHAYPTLSELNKFGAGEYMKTRFTPLLKKFLRLWNNFED